MVRCNLLYIHTDLNEFYCKFTDVIWKCAKNAFQVKNKSTGFKRDFALDDVSTHLNKVITILTNIYLVIAYCTCKKEKCKVFAKIHKLIGSNYHPGDMPDSFEDTAFTKWSSYQEKVKACLKQAKKDLKVHIAKKKHQFIVNKVEEIRSERGSACPNKFFRKTDPDNVVSSQQLYDVLYIDDTKTNPDGTPLKITSAFPKTVKSVVEKVWGKIFSSAKSQSSLIFPGWNGKIFQHNR